MVFFINKDRLYNIIFSLALAVSLVSGFTGRGDNVLKSSTTPISGKVIVIDAGHGTPDSGATGYSGTREKDVNLALSKSLGNLLQQSGVHVIYTRENDGTIADNLDTTIRNIKLQDMKKRRHIRDESKADMFISIHMNIYSDPKVKGAQVFYKEDNKESKLLANLIQENICRTVDTSNKRQAKNSKNDIYLLNDSKIPSVLVECGFLSNPGEEKKLLSKSYQDKMAYAIYSGILKYFTTNT